MSFLSRLRKIDYPHPTKKNNSLRLRDVSFAINFIERKIKDEYLETYDLTHGETPDQASESIYGDPSHAWILLLLNDAIDPFFDWYKTEEQVRRIAEDRYDDIFEIHHHEDADGVWVDFQEVDSTIGVVPVTNIQFELNENDEKRQIRYIRNTYLQNLISQLEKEVGDLDG